MISFSEVQSTLAALLHAHTSLAPVPLVEDLGTTVDEKSIEDALQEKGIAISVTVPLRGKTADLKGGTAILDVEILALVAVNTDRNDPETNDTALGLGLFDLVKWMVEAVLRPAAAPLNPNDRFALAEDALQLDVLDAGLFRYAITFRKKCVL